MDFLCRDSEGTVLINPQDAEIYSKHSHRIRRGNRIYIETWMQVEDPLYALGSAELDTEQMDRLILQKNKDFPFLLANLPERQVLLRKSRAAIFTTNLGLNGGVFSADSFRYFRFLRCYRLPFRCFGRSSLLWIYDGSANV